MLGRVEALANRRLVGRFAPADLALIMAELLDPDDPQSLDRRQPAQPEALRLVEQGSQQIVAIRANDLGERLAGGQAPGQAVLLDPGAITLQPVRPVVLDQPLRSGSRDGVEGGRATGTVGGW